MAGILISMGDRKNDFFEPCVKDFQTTKQLKISCQEKTDEIRVAKFIRKNEEDDNFALMDSDLYIVIGTLIYRSEIGKKALYLLHQDLKESTIERVTKDMDGPFFLFILNFVKKRVVAVTDHAGIMNIYSYIDADNFYLSSSSRILSRALAVTPNAESIIQFLRTASICDLDTIYDEIKLLEPGTIYIFNLTNGISYEKLTYWSSPVEIETALSYQDAKEKLKWSIFDSLKWIKNEKIVCDMTAGFDSRLIMANLLKQREEKELFMEAFVFGPDYSKEVLLVKQYETTMGIKLKHLSLPENWSEIYHDYIEKSLNVTDGEESAFYYSPILYAYEMKQKKYDIAFNGLGGELYRDFWWIQEIFFNRRKANYLKLINNRVLQYEYDYSIFSDQWKKLILGVNNIFAKRYINTNSDMNLEKSFNTLQIDNIYFRQKIRRWAGRTISSSNHLIRTISPLTFKRNLEVAMSIPPKYKLLGKIVRDVIADLAPSVANLLMLNGTPCIPLNFKNVFKFSPLITDFEKKIIRKASQKIFKKTILTDQSIIYKQSEWIKMLVNNSFYDKYLNIDNMVSGKIYDKSAFKKFIESATLPNFSYLGQLGNIATLEMRMKTDNIKDF